MHRVFIRTQPSVLELMKRSAKSENPHQVYKNLVTENAPSPGPTQTHEPQPVPKPVPKPAPEPEPDHEPDHETTSEPAPEPSPEPTPAVSPEPVDCRKAPSVHEAISQPRNVRQVRYFKDKEKQKLLISRDPIMNLNAMAFEDGFIQHITLFPDLIVVCGDDKLIAEFETVVSNSTENILLSYDTTFNLGEFYVSPILFKHVAFKEQPVVPLLFLVHERKFTYHHQVVFKILKEKMSTPSLLKRVTIVTDMEQGIINAIEEETPMKKVGCWRHLVKDIERWITTHGGKSADRLVYVEHVLALLRCRSEEEFKELKDSYVELWSDVFTEYFDKHISPKLKYFARYVIDDFVTFDQKYGVTSNMSEGFNWLLKDLNNWKELPVDSMVLSFRFLQNYYRKEISRGKVGIGQYSLKKSFEKMAIDVVAMETIKVIPIKEIVSSIKNKERSYIAQEVKSMYSQHSTIARATEIVENDQISFSAKLGIFSVGSGKNVYSVKLNPEVCTCPGQKKCVHILAVRMALKIPTDDSYAKVVNLTILRKNARQKKKPGRKRPRVGDIEIVPPETNTGTEKVEKADIEVSTDQPDEDAISTDKDYEETASTGEPVLDISDTELRQEIEDSLHDSMWLVNKDGISLNLTTEDKDRLNGSLDKGWLNDKLIDACHAVLHQARPDLGGLQSCLLAVKPAFRPESNPFLQIINTDPEVGTHWILLSTLDCPKGVINVYDSANCNSLSPSVQKSIAKLMQFKGDIITIRFMKCPQQTNGNDCGVYAIANAVQLSFGVDPANISTYSLPQCMRQHIHSCLEAGNFSKFSHGKSRRY